MDRDTRFSEFFFIKQFSLTFQLNREYLLDVKNFLGKNPVILELSFLNEIKSEKKKFFAVQQIEKPTKNGVVKLYSVVGWNEIVKKQSSELAREKKSRKKFLSPSEKPRKTSDSTHKKRRQEKKIKGEISQKQAKKSWLKVLHVWNKKK